MGDEKTEVQEGDEGIPVVDPQQQEKLVYEKHHILLQSKQKNNREGSIYTLEICRIKKGIQREGGGTCLLVDRAAAQMNNRLKSSSSAIVPPLPSVDLHGGREIWERGGRGGAPTVDFCVGSSLAAMAVPPSRGDAAACTIGAWTNVAS
jgi:FtsP/CotA-like multicopper oxidase with cupredoxin domain